METDPRSSLGAHLGAAFRAAGLLGLFQIVLESVLIALRTREFILSPYRFFSTQLYDFCVKLAALLTGIEGPLRGGVLDRFQGVGFAAKLGLGLGCIAPNVAVLGLVALLLAIVGRARRKPASVAHAAGLLVACGAAAHAVTFFAAVHVPDAWTVLTLTRNAAHVLIWDGAWLSGLTFVLAASATWLVASRRTPAPTKALLGLAAILAAFLTISGGSRVSSHPLPPARSQPSFRSIAPVDNLILISIDSLRADRVGCYGNPRNASPALDRLAREGVRFTTALSTTSWTLPSHISMLTGRYLLSHGVMTEMDRLPDAIPTLAEVLQRGGVATGAVVSAPLLDPTYGFARGFDDFDRSTAPRKGPFDSLRAEPANEGTALALRWLHQRAGGRFFLFLHYWDVHYDYIPPPPYDRMFDPDYTGTVTGEGFYHNRAINRGMRRRDLDHLIALYDGELRWVDDHIARVAAALEELGIAERTAIIVTSDHGDEFFEHGHKGHTRTLYREVVDIPLIIRAPGVRPGHVVDAPVSLVDVMPTALELMGMSVPTGIEGRSLLALLTGGKIARSEALYGWLCQENRHGNCQAMQYSRDGTLIHRFQPNARDATFRYGFQPMGVEFYEPDDWKQEDDRAASSTWPRGDQLSRLSENLNSQWSSYQQLNGQQGSVKVDEETRKRLRALGYGD
jgi:arylsulfatase A-like enzyme